MSSFLSADLDAVLDESGIDGTVAVQARQIVEETEFLLGIADAKPRIAREAFDSEWAAGIRDLAKRDHVSCKISCMLTEVRDAEWDFDLLRPYFDTIYEAFGPDRVMYGSDWPVCLLRDSYANWVKTVDQLAATLSADEQAALWGGNAGRIYQL